MLFLARFRLLNEIKLTSPESFEILFTDKSKFLKLSSLDIPFITYILLLLRKSCLRLSPSSPDIYYILFSEISKISKFWFLLTPSITEIEFAFKFNTLKNLCLDKSLIFIILLLLTSKKSRCKGTYFTSNIDVN